MLVFRGPYLCRVLCICPRYNYDPYLEEKCLKRLARERLKSSHYFTRAFLSMRNSPMDLLPLIAVAQLNCNANKSQNFEVCKDLIERASRRGAKMIFLPEGCDYLAESKKESLAMAESLSGPTVTHYCKLAASNNIWLSVGGVHIKEEGDSKINNTHLLISEHGNVMGKYSKVHMFDVNIPESNINLQESKYVQSGNSIPKPVMTPCGLVAPGICYDLRFPEFSLMQRKMGAQILTFPSAFTLQTGLAHWHILLRARAVENQCYVIAAAQTGQHNSKRASYGHSLVVDPWGTVVAEVSEGIGVAFAEIDLKYLEKVRLDMPVIHHRRSDLYFLCDIEGLRECRLTEILPFPKSNLSYKFGHVSVPADSIFLKTLLSQAFTNRKPFTPGHVLITPERPARRFVDLTEAEVSDIVQTVVLTLKVIRKQFTPEVVQIAIQDGVHSGQTVEHVHVHLVPLNNNSKPLIEKYENDVEKPWRNDSDMKTESSLLRILVSELAHSDTWLDTSEIPRSLVLRSCKEGQFGGKGLSVGRTILCSEMSFSFLSSNPVLPGHAIICPNRGVSSLIELSPAEVTDLFLCTQKVQKLLESYYRTFSSTIFALDKKEGEASADLAIHILSRQENDLEKDGIYSRLLLHQENDSNENYDQDLLKFMRKNMMSDS